MKNKLCKEKSLETISLRGNKKLWLDFSYTAKKRGAKNIWEVLEKLIRDYLD